MNELPRSGERFRRELLAWAEDNLRVFPWREESRTLYEVFVAEFFLTQTPAGNVATVYPEFLDRFPELISLRTSEPDEVAAVIEPLGFQRMRADALVAIAEEFDSLPREREELLDLHRVGPYVADATLCFACDRPLPILDRNVVRTYDRVFGPEFPDSERARRDFAARMLPGEGHEAREYNLALLDFGALVCQKRDPLCSECFAAEYCHYHQTST